LIDSVVDGVNLDVRQVMPRKALLLDGCNEDIVRAALSGLPISLDRHIDLPVSEQVTSRRVVYVIFTVMVSEWC
jgi:hypothetical protein